MWPGPYLHSVEVSSLRKCSSDIADDQLNYGISCTKKLLKYAEIVVSYPSEASRLKKDAAEALQTEDPAALANADYVVFTNATLLTMEYGNLQQDVLSDAILITRGLRLGGSISPDGNTRKLAPRIPLNSMQINTVQIFYLGWSA